MSISSDAALAGHRIPNRLLWVNDAADFVGGCEQYIFNTVRLLRERGIRSTLLYDCRHPRFSTDFAVAFDQAFPLVNAQVQVRSIKPDVIYIHRLSDTSALRELKETGIPTARFFHDYQIFCPREHRYSTIGLRTCRKPMGMRCYFPCLGFINRSENGIGIRMTPVRMLLAQISQNKKLDAFIVGSQYMAKLIAEHGFESRRIHVLPLYVLPPQDAVEATRESDLILFAGQLIRSKGLDTLLRAMAATTRPCRLAIAGQGRQEHVFREMTRRLHLESRVSFLGRIPHEELAHWYARAAAVVVPSRYPETFGLVGPEAMRYGAAVIGTTVGAIEEWLEDELTGFAVPPNDPITMASAIDRITADPNTAITMGSAGKRRCAERFCPQRHIDSLLALFGSLVARGGDCA
ncbi:MAG: glycosyltransferase family 4 protein [Candidatus Hydrogenedentes bacterium]|nr:glycosyltransferase family 4 protein [Candidatus Hydrogenedentota bacterium]